MFVTKIISQLAEPISLALMALGLALVLRLVGWVRVGRSLTATTIVALWLAATPLVSGWSIQTLERQYPPVAIEDMPVRDVGILLGGTLSQPLPPRKYLEMSDAVDRVWHAARLYRAGKIKHVLIAAGNVSWHETVASEAELIRGLLLDWNVPAEAVSIEKRSRTTRENAVNVKPFLAEHSWQSLVLITSGWHMPRAIAVFRKAGVEVTPSSTDVQVAGTQRFGPIVLLPNARALAQTTRAFREWMGILYYWLRGWV